MWHETVGWQKHQLNHRQIIYTLLQTDNHTSTLSLNFLLVGCSSWCSTNSVKTLKACYYSNGSKNPHCHHFWAFSYIHKVAPVCIFIWYMVLRQIVQQLCGKYVAWNETWPIRKENEVAHSVGRGENGRWMCDVKLQDRVPSEGWERDYD